MGAKCGGGKMPRVVWYKTSWGQNASRGVGKRPRVVWYKYVGEVSEVEQGCSIMDGGATKLVFGLYYVLVFISFVFGLHLTNNQAHSP